MAAPKKLNYEALKAIDMADELVAQKTRELEQATAAKLALLRSHDIPVDGSAVINLDGTLTLLDPEEVATRMNRVGPGAGHSRPTDLVDEPSVPPPEPIKIGEVDGPADPA